MSQSPQAHGEVTQLDASRIDAAQVGADQASHFTAHLQAAFVLWYGVKGRVRVRESREESECEGDGPNSRTVLHLAADLPARGGGDKKHNGKRSEWKEGLSLHHPCCCVAVTSLLTGLLAALDGLSRASNGRASSACSRCCGNAEATCGGTARVCGACELVCCAVLQYAMLHLHTSSGAVNGQVQLHVRERLIAKPERGWRCNNKRRLGAE